VAIEKLNKNLILALWFLISIFHLYKKEAALEWKHGDVIKLKLMSTFGINGGFNSYK
jgi:hypothetical protein